MRTKKLFNFLYKDLYKKYKLYDYGIDWLKFNVDLGNVDDKISSDLILFSDNPDDFLNSTTGNLIYGYNLNGYTYDLNCYKSPVGYTFQFLGSFDQFGLSGSKALFDISYITSFKKYPYFLVNIYGLAFQLHKIKQFDIEKNIFPLFGLAKNTRVDFNFNFDTLNLNPSIIISKFQNKYSDLNFVSFGSDSLQYRLYEKKGKSNDGKVKYRLTHRFGLRLYNKSKQIVDANIVGLYPQYDGKSILRLEGVLGSEYLDNVYFNGYGFDLPSDYVSIYSLDDLFNYVCKLVFDKDISLKRKIDDKHYSQYYLKKILDRSASDIGSRIQTYLEKGGDIDNIVVNGKSLRNFIYDYKPETYFI